MTVGCPTLIDTSTTQLLHPKFRECSTRGDRKIARARRSGGLLHDCLLKWQRRYSHNTSTIWLPKQDQHNNHTSAHANKVGGNAHSAPCPDKELWAANNCRGREISLFSQGRCLLIGYSMPSGHPWHIHTGRTRQTQEDGCIYIHVPINSNNKGRPWI